jgi:hypothetical protein
MGSKRWLVASAAVLSACTAGGSGHAASSATHAASSPAPCRRSQLKVSVGVDRVANGHVGAAIIFTNTSKESCTIGGYPAVGLLGVNLDVAVTARQTLQGPMGGLTIAGSTISTVLLSEGQTASALLEAVEPTTEGVAPAPTVYDCPTYSGISVTLPGVGSQKLARPFAACEPIEIHPLLRGPIGSPIP